MWYRTLSLCTACTQSSDIILIPQATFAPNFLSVTTSVAELAHGEKLRTQLLTHSAYVMPQGTKALALENCKIASKYVMLIYNEQNLTEHWANNGLQPVSSTYTHFTSLQQLPELV